MNSETFTLPQDAPEVVGTCKLDTYRFIINSFGKLILILKILIFSICSRTKTENIFPKNIEIRKIRKIDIFWIFRILIFFGENIFVICSRTYRKNQNFQNQNCFPETINNKPVRVQSTSSNYLRRIPGQGKRLRIHGFWRNLPRGQKKTRICLILVTLKKTTATCLFILPKVLDG